jgi:minor extracellular serine protease Vpr
MNFALLGLVVVTLLSGCSSQRHQAHRLTADYEEIFSTRPQLLTHTVVMLKLKDAPLLQSLGVDAKGKKVLDPKKVEALDRVHEAFVKSLADVSPDIKVIYRYRMAINGFAVVTPVEFVDRIRGLSGISHVEAAADFSRPEIPHPQTSQWRAVFERTSVKFIEADRAHALGFRGQGMHVGVIDTGIDYTHAMFGGAGAEDVYSSIDPSKPTPHFPNAKVAGGKDFVGSGYGAGSGNFMDRIPKPDDNPIDESGHGTHVAGTVAGVGDGVNTYDGVAPEAQLHALKVFGKNGGTSDVVVIAALEYAADPDGNGDLSDQLDVVNLSLGGSYGQPRILYSEAIRNLARSGTAVVASGGNSGDFSYIVGAPGSSDDALSVAASVDDMSANWQFPAVRFKTFEDSEIYAEAIEARITKSIEESGNVTGQLVFAGLADQEFTEPLKGELKGKVAFIDRGVVSFTDKIRRAAEAGAIGVVVANNQPGEASAMGGEGSFPVPAVMITQALGQKLKAAMKTAPVEMEFKPEKMIEKPELIDSITGFSSRGPRSQDALIKPEISAPGSRIVSAKSGSGTGAVALSGTSMAAPHLAGVMALLKQARPELSVADLKSLVMGTSKSLQSPDGKLYPVSRQGAGRVQVMAALEGQVISRSHSVSLGEMVVEQQKTVPRSLVYRNLTNEDQEFELRFEGHPSIRLIAPGVVRIPAGSETQVALRFVIEAKGLAEGATELGGWVKLASGEKETSRVPVLAVVNKAAQVSVSRLEIHSTSAADAAGSLVELTLRNPGVNTGDAYVFNLIGRDGRKKDPANDPERSRDCDLAESGYRVVLRDGVEYFQVVVKLHEPMTTWDACGVSVLIDATGDGEADQELAGIKQEYVAGLAGKSFVSVLLDAPMAKAIRKSYEQAQQAGDEKAELSYAKAIVSLEPMKSFDHATVAILEAPLKVLKLRPTGELAVRVASSYAERTAIEPDDFLVKDPRHWTRLNLREQGAGFVGMPEKVRVEAGGSVIVPMVKGVGSERMLVVYPQNATWVGGIGRDRQSETPRVVYRSAPVPKALRQPSAASTARL